MVCSIVGNKTNIEFLTCIMIEAGDDLSLRKKPTGFFKNLNGTKETVLCNCIVEMH